MTPVTLGAGWPHSQSHREADARRSGDARDPRASLKHILDQAGSMPLPAALLMFDDVLDALEKRQVAGAVHGAVSVGAIRVDERGRCHLPTDDEQGAAYVTGRGGTHRYAAPEVRRGGSVTATADAYAATAVLAEALTGLPPDVARDVITTDSAGSTTLPENPVPPAVRRLVDLGMAADEARRPPNAAALRDALSTASTAAFPMVDWRARGRAWLAAAVPAAAGAASQPAPAPTPGGWAAMRTAVAPAPPAAGTHPTPSTGMAVAAQPMPWQSQIPSFTPSPRPAYDWEDDRLPPLPGFFRRLGRGDPGIVAGCGIAVIGVVLVLIGGGVALGMSGPNNASASPATPGYSAPAGSSGGDGSPTPPVVGSSLVPGPAGSANLDESPNASASASAAASPSPSTTDTGLPTFSPVPEPSFSVPPTPAPTPTSCFLFC